MDKLISFGFLIEKEQRSELPVELNPGQHQAVVKPRTVEGVQEGSEFELPVPVSKLSDDSIVLEFATA